MAGQRSQRGRLVAGGLAIAVAAFLLLAAFVSQRWLVVQGPQSADALLTDLELHLAATDTIHPHLPDTLVSAMRADPRVKTLVTAITVRATDMAGLPEGGLDTDRFYDEKIGGGWITGRRDAFLAWEPGGPTGEITQGRGLATEDADPIGIVLRRGYTMGVKPGDWRWLESDTGVHRARVVGVAAAAGGSFTPPEARLMARQITRAAAERLAGGPQPPSDARITFATADDRQRFTDEWRPRLKDFPGELELWDRAAVRRIAAQSPALESARIAVITSVLLAAACVICVSYGVQASGVRDRLADYGRLRALGARPSLLAALTVLEALVLAVLGMLGAWVLAWGMLQGLAAYVPFVRLPTAPDTLSLASTFAVVLAAVLVGGASPVWTAMRTRPGEVTATALDPASITRWRWRPALAAIVVLAAAAWLVRRSPASSLERARMAMAVGLPAAALAGVLLTPWFLWLATRLLARPVAALTRIPALALSDHVNGDSGRSAGSVVAIGVGLSAFILALTWGVSMLNAFVIDPAVPRWFVSIHPYGLDQAETEHVLASPTFRSYQPLTLVDTRLAGSNDVPTLVMGLDSGRALNGGLPIRFMEGDAATAIRELPGGHACLISDWYAASVGVHVGDTIRVASPNPNGPIDRAYRVAGVVDLLGWRMATKQNKVRLRGDKHRVLVILDANAVRRDFPVAHTNFLLGDPPDRGGYHGDAPAAAAARQALEAELGQIVDLHRPLTHQPDGGSPVTLKQRVAQVDDLDHTRHALLGDWGGAAVQKLGYLPLVILGVSLVSVAGALAASFRSKSRELGVLRCCGLTRFGLVRLAVGESLLLGLAAIPLSLLAGLAASVFLLDITSAVGYRMDFAGIQPRLEVPWGWLWPGAVVLLAVCVLAALASGARICRRPPAALLTRETA